MYLKIVILLFCVALYFLQCQGDDPTQEQLETIKNIVKNYENPDGINVEENRDPTINLNGVKDVIVEVAERFNIQIEHPSLEELQTIGSSYTSTLWEVKRHAAIYLNYDELDREMTNTTLLGRKLHTSLLIISFMGFFDIIIIF
ncbi:uncharacterized protein LOC126841280 [Adelges cooleyi]|uniref:uncharacterized protein LOC126841280 n=1 Tax=Adelges cooleyi TaxID=133065 RepID=UPI00217F49EA|nr:uncharacterized protein LOC126841280 [Adelges cooleyi]